MYGGADVNLVRPGGRGASEQWDQLIALMPFASGIGIELDAARSTIGERADLVRFASPCIKSAIVEE